MKKFEIIEPDLVIAYRKVKEAYNKLLLLYKNGDVNIPPFCWKRTQDGYRLEVKKTMLLDFSDKHKFGFKEINMCEEAFKTLAINRRSSKRTE